MGIQVILSMDWEGTALHSQNLEAIRDFKKSWGAPIVHYYNPAYYTNPMLKKVRINKEVKSVLESNDELGLHIHTPSHFVKAANILPRVGPCFSQYGDYNLGEFSGQEVMLLAYSKPEIKHLLNYSLEVLSKNGFKELNSFRAGGWMSDEKVWEALIETGFSIESSATNYHYLNGSSWEGDNLQRYISLIWGNMGINTKPYFLQTFSGSIYEVPNNLGAIDYWREQYIEDHLEQISCEYKKDNDLLLVINSHQETFKDHKGKLETFLDGLEDAFGPNNIEFTTNSDVFSRSSFDTAN